MLLPAYFRSQGARYWRLCRRIHISSVVCAPLYGRGLYCVMVCASTGYLGRKQRMRVLNIFARLLGHVLPGCLLKRCALMGMGRALDQVVVACVIYEILHVPTGYRYIGMSSRGLGVRRREHVAKLRRQRHTCAALQQAWNADGEGAFIFRTIDLMPATTTVTLLRQRENEWRQVFGPILFNPLKRALKKREPTPLVTPEFARVFWDALAVEVVRWLLVFLSPHRARLDDGVIQHATAPSRDCSCKRKPKRSEGFEWPYPAPVIVPRRTHLGPPVGMPERRSVMYPGRRDHIRLAEIRAAETALCRSDDNGTFPVQTASPKPKRWRFPEASLPSLPQSTTEPSQK